MTDEPREESRDEEEDVEGHGTTPDLESEKFETDEDDVDAHVLSPEVTPEATP